MSQAQGLAGSEQPQHKAKAKRSWVSASASLGLKWGLSRDPGSRRVRSDHQPCEKEYQ